MKFVFKLGIADAKLRIFLPDTTSLTGSGKTGLTFASSGLIISAIADNEATGLSYNSAASTIETITTLGTFATPTAGKCRFREVDATLYPGTYEIQLAATRWAVTAARSLLVCAQCDSVPPTYAETELTGPTNLIDTDIAALVGDALAALAFRESALAIARGSAAAGSTTTVINTTGLVPVLADAGQLTGRAIIFDRGTASAGLRGQAAIVQSSTTGAGAALTVSPPLTSAPAAGDTFGVY
jgi:hypothetical protein